VAVLTERFTVAHITSLRAEISPFPVRRPERNAVVAGRPFQMTFRAVTGRPSMTLGALFTDSLRQLAVVGDKRRISVALRKRLFSMASLAFFGGLLAVVTLITDRHGGRILAFRILEMNQVLVAIDTGQPAHFDMRAVWNQKVAAGRHVTILGMTLKTYLVRWRGIIRRAFTADSNQIGVDLSGGPHEVQRGALPTRFGVTRQTSCVRMG